MSIKLSMKMNEVEKMTLVLQINDEDFERACNL